MNIVVSNETTAQIEASILDTTLEIRTLKNDADKWLNLINKYFILSSNSRLGIILHFVERDLLEDSYVIKNIVNLNPLDLDLKDLTQMKNEVLYMLKKDIR